MHKKVADTLNDKRVKGMEPMSLSQYDMLVTQVNSKLLLI